VPDAASGSIGVYSRKFSGETIVAPRLPSSRATYPPANPPPTTSVPPNASAMPVFYEISASLRERNRRSGSVCTSSSARR
jgi:hypothetical protein